MRAARTGASRGEVAAQGRQRPLVAREGQVGPGLGGGRRAHHRQRQPGPGDRPGEPEGVLPVGEEERREGLHLGQRRDPQRRLGHDPQPPLGAEDRVAQVRPGGRGRVRRQLQRCPPAPRPFPRRRAPRSGRSPPTAGPSCAWPPSRRPSRAPSSAGSGRGSGSGPAARPRRPARPCRRRSVASRLASSRARRPGEARERQCKPRRTVSGGCHTARPRSSHRRTGRPGPRRPPPRQAARGPRAASFGKATPSGTAPSRPAPQRDPVGQALAPRVAHAHLGVVHDQPVAREARRGDRGDDVGQGRVPRRRRRARPLARWQPRRPAAARRRWTRRPSRSSVACGDDAPPRAARRVPFGRCERAGSHGPRYATSASSSSSQAAR